jgi:hypothetical protein
MILLIPVIGSFLQSIPGSIIALLGGGGAIFSALVVWLARQYLVPYLAVEKRRRYAEYIALIADEVTDDLIRKYPESDWMKRLDEAVDKIMEICGIEDEIARRAASAAISRK